MSDNRIKGLICLICQLAIFGKYLGLKTIVWRCKGCS